MFSRILYVILYFVFSLRPLYGLIHTHFTIDEIEWLSDKTGASFEDRIFEMERILRTDLKECEYQIRLSVKPNYQKIGLTPWYIVLLILYGRINVSLETIVSLKFRSSDIIFDESPFISKKEYDYFITVGKDILKYKKGIVTVLFVLLQRIILYYQKPINQVVDYLDEYKEKVKYISKGGYHNICALKNVLSNMGYKTNISSKRQLKSNIELLKCSNSELLEGYLIYYNYIILHKSYKTAETELSHIRTFLNFINNEFKDITRFKEIKNEHIIRFIKVQETIINERGKNNCPATINHRVQSVDKMLRFFRSKCIYDISDNIISKFDCIKEHKVLPKYISRSEIYKLLDVIKSIDENKYFLEKMALIILMDTGRRVNEVLSLKLDCLKISNGRYQLFFHKIKHGASISQDIGQASVKAVTLLIEYAKEFKTPLYSKFDGLVARRLFPSKYYKGGHILSDTALSEFFKRIQIENSIIDENGKAKYRLHDSKRNFIANALSSGISPIEISKYLCQELNSIIPYEVYNEQAIKAIKFAEQRGLLVGNSFNTSIKDEPNDYCDIINIFKDRDVVERHKENLIFKFNNPQECIPLDIGFCTDISYINTCGRFICYACEQFRTKDLNAFDQYVIKVYKYINRIKALRQNNDIKVQIEKALRNVYVNLENYSEDNFLNKLKELKKRAKEHSCNQSK